ncbi:MAG: DUF1854 domain-containing protein [bacterium]|nr:DUF1854 domain-containing protein [bacterium]
MNLERRTETRTPEKVKKADHRLATHPSLHLQRRVDGQLWATKGEQTRPVWVCRCFPWSDPGTQISLRDEEEDEFALVSDPSKLDSGSREALELALVEAGFVLEILRVDECEEEVEIRTWKVQTRQGERRFQTRRDDWPLPIPGGGLLIRDVAGDLFLVREPDELDRHSRGLLWAFVD